MHSNMFHKCIFVIFMLSIFQFSFLRPVHADSKNERVKVAFVWNFILYTNWSADIGDKLNLCLLGDVSFIKFVDLIKNKPIKGRLLEIKHLKNIESTFDECQVIFVADSLSQTDLGKLLKRINNKPILTISSMEGFASQGGMINLIQVKNKRKFEINLGSATSAGIKFSSKMLKLSHRIIQAKETKPTEINKENSSNNTSVQTGDIAQN